MNYFLIKLAFDTAVHFGPSDTAQSLSVSEDHFYADTMFSALCHTALQLSGKNALEQLCDWVRKGELLFSDSMPWREEDYFLPKPFVLSENRREMPASLQKAMKKLAWIPVRSFRAFSESVHGGTPFDPSQSAVAFGVPAEVTRAAVSDGMDAVPYRVGLYRFQENCGLFIIAAVRTEEQERILISLFRALGMSGIGGKVSSGCGKFHLEDVVLLNEFYDDQTEWLYCALSKKTGRNLLLSACLPKEEELESVLKNAAFQMVRRGGFVASDTYAETPMKKKTQFFFRAGSMFSRRFEGALYSVGSFGAHPVYRYAKPLFLGVDL